MGCVSLLYGSFVFTLEYSKIHLCFFRSQHKILQILAETFSILINSWKAPSIFHLDVFTDTAVFFVGGKTVLFISMQLLEKQTTSPFFCDISKVHFAPGVDLILIVLLGSLEESYFCQMNCVRRHLYGTEQITQSSSLQHSAGGFFFHRLRVNHILSEDFPTNFIDSPTSPKLIASGLQSPIMSSLPSVSHFWCFLIRVAVPSSQVSTQR